MMMQSTMPDPDSTSDGYNREPSPLVLLDIAVYYLFLLHVGLLERSAVVNWADETVMKVEILPNWILTISLGSQLSSKELLASIYDEAELRHMKRGFQLLCASLLVTKPAVTVNDEPFLELMYPLYNYLFDEDVQFQLSQCCPCHPECSCCWEHIPGAYSKLLQFGLPVLEYRIPGSIVQPVQFTCRYE
jgi:hypothetical protein